MRVKALTGAVLGIASFAIAFLMFVTSCVSYAYAEATFIPALNRYDFMFDDARGLLYITASDRVLRYDVVSARFLAPWVLGGQLRGVDVSPDGKTVAVGDRRKTPGADYAPWTMWTHFIDVETGKDTPLSVVGESVEDGFCGVAYGSDGRVVISPGPVNAYSSHRYLRVYDPVSGDLVKLAADGGWWLSRSADRNTIGVSGSSSSWGVFSVPSGFIARLPWDPWSGQVLGQIAVSRDGSRFALMANLYPAENRIVTRVFDREQAQVAEISPPNGFAYGHGFSSVTDTLYVTAASTPWVIAYDTTLATETARYDVGQQIEPDYWADWRASRVAVSDDDGLLAVFVPKGIRVLRRLPAVEGVVRSSFHGGSVEGAVVELWKQSGESWSLDATAATGPGGSWSHTTEDTAPVRIHVSDPSGAHASGWVGGDSLERATSAVATTSLQVSADTTLTLVTPGSIEGTLTSSLENRPAAGMNVSVYLGEIAGSPVTSVATDEDGRYQVDVAPGDYRLAFADPSGAHQPAYYQSASSTGTARTVHVRGPTTAVATQTLTFIPFKMAGAVRSEYRSQPIGWALVELWQRGESGSYGLLATVTAGAGGAWSFEPTQSAPVRVRASDPSGMHDPIWLGGSDLDGATDVVPTRGAPANADVAMPLTHPGSIMGTVRNDWQSKPVDGATVTLTVADGTTTTPVATATTAPDGTYVFPAVGPSAYLVSFSDPTGAHVPIAPPALVSVSSTLPVTCDVTMHFVPLKLHGRVKSLFHDVPIPSANVEIWRQGASHEWAREATVTAAGDGTWSYSTDSTAAARVRISDPSLMNDPVWFGGATDLESAADVVPARADIPFSDVTLGLVRPASLTGYVFDSYTESATPGVEVRLCLNVPGVPVVATTTVDADGAFEFDGLGHASYYMFLEDPSGTYRPRWWYAGDSFAGANAFTLSSPGEWWFEEDIYIDRTQIQYDAVFSVTQIVGSGTPLAGDPVTLTAFLSETLWDEGLQGVAVTLEKSTDGVHWATADDATVYDDEDGDYSAVVVPDTVGARFYRFKAGPDADVAAAYSSPVLISPLYRPASWGAPFVVGYADGAVVTIPPGVTPTLRGCLRDAAGTPVAASAVVLEGSSDGVAFRPLKAMPLGPLNMPGTYWYEDKVSGALAPYLRLRVLPGGRYAPVASSPVRIRGPWVLQLTSAVPKRVRPNRAFRISGRVAPLFSPARARVNLKIERRSGSRWKSAGTYRTYAYASNASFRFSPKLKRGTYRLRLEVPANNLRQRTLSRYYAVTVR